MYSKYDHKLRYTAKLYFIKYWIASFIFKTDPNMRHEIKINKIRLYRYITKKN